MGQSTSQTLRSAVAAWISIPVALGIFFLVDWLFRDQMRWIEFGVFTTIVFGILGVRVYEDLKRAKCLIVFTGLLALHCAGFLHILRSGIEIRTAWYVPIGAAESFVFGLILTGPGGARSEENDPD